MKVSEAVQTRRSVRAFKNTPVPLETVREILTLATRAPSGSNLQPWRVTVLTGAARDEFVRLAMADFAVRPMGETSDYVVHPPVLSETYKDRYLRAGAMMYGAAGVARDDADGRLRQRAKNVEFFGAPVGLMFTIDRVMGPGQWADVGMFMQTIMLLAREYGLDTCAQEAWAIRPSLIRAFLRVPDDQLVYCGMALGYADERAPVNGFQSERAPLEEVITFRR